MASIFDNMYMAKSQRRQHTFLINESKVKEYMAKDILNFGDLLDESPLKYYWMRHTFHYRKVESKDKEYLFLICQRGEDTYIHVLFLLRAIYGISEGTEIYLSKRFEGFPTAESDMLYQHGFINIKYLSELMVNVMKNVVDVDQIKKLTYVKFFKSIDISQIS